jgi:hypothetical protein
MVGTATMTPESSAVTAFRGAAVERAILGLTTLNKPDAVSRRIAPGSSMPPTWLARLLGARLLAQAVVQFARPRRNSALAGAAIDAAHASSMIPVAALLPAYRRIALASALEAVSAAAVSILVAGRLP